MKNFGKELGEPDEPRTGNRRVIDQDGIDPALADRRNRVGERIPIVPIELLKFRGVFVRDGTQRREIENDIGL